jgi:hypothetical protein
MTQIIGFAGKKQSGKNVSCNFILMLQLIKLGACERVRLNQEGQLEVTDIFGEYLNGGDFYPLESDRVDYRKLYEDISGEVKVYAIADPLKQIAIEVMGLPRAKVYGSEDDKNSKTKFKWQNMPGVICDRKLFKSLKESHDGELPFIYHKSGFMTIRDILQHVGTEIFRKMYSEVWSDTLIRRIEEDQPKVALVCDARFDNEIKAIKKENGVVIGLLRDIYQSTDSHSSEQISFNLCNHAIDNSKMSIDEQCKSIHECLRKLDCRHINFVQN